MAEPTKYKSQYCEQLIEHLKKGYSFYSFGGEVGVSKQTLFTWAEKHPEFSEAKKIGESLALKYFEKILIAKLSGQPIKNFDHKLADTTLLIFTLKTRFHKFYGEKNLEEDDAIDLDFSEN